MLTKFFLGLAIIAFTTYCGYLFSKKHRKKKVFFQQFYLFNERFLNEITYYRRPLTEIILSDKYAAEFSLLLNSFLQSIKENQAIWLQYLHSLDFNFLTQEEKNEVENYFSCLGKGDVISQKNYFSSIQEKLKNKSGALEIKVKKIADLYVKLGFLCGLLILILIL